MKNDAQIEAEGRQYYSDRPVDAICAEFGCGKKLTSQEKLFGKYCVKHNGQQKPPMKKENLYTPDCIRTVSGKYVNVFDPDPETICIEDIAHALSQQCRFGGHLPQFYSVAQHCIFCCDMGEEDKLELLMHDSSEGYLLDIPRPIKLKLANYKEIEDSLMKVIAKKFGFNWPVSEEVKKIDEKLLRIEWNALMLERKNNIEVYSPAKAKTFFMERFNRFKK